MVDVLLDGAGLTDRAGQGQIEHDWIGRTHRRRHVCSEAQQHPKVQANSVHDKDFRSLAGGARAARAARKSRAAASSLCGLVAAAQPPVSSWDSFLASKMHAEPRLARRWEPH